MATNFPGPYEVEINYTGDGRSHKMRLSCQLDSAPPAGADLSVLNVIQRDGASAGLTSVVPSFVNLMQPMFSGATDFNDFTLWKYTAGTFERLFIGTAQIGLSGTNAGVLTRAHYRMFTFRTANGSILKINQLEDAGNGNDKTPYVSAGVSEQALMDFITGQTNWIYGRDNSYPIAALNVSEGQNEAIWRKIYR